MIFPVVGGGYPREEGPSPAQLLRNFITSTSQRREAGSEEPESKACAFKAPGKKKENGDG